MNTGVWTGFGSLLLSAMLLIGGVAQGQPVEDPGIEPQQAQQALSFVGSIAAGEPHDLVVTCAGYNCGREHDLVYYDVAQDADGWRHVEFVDAETLQAAGEGVRVSGFSRVGPLLYDPHHRQVYAFGERDECDDWGTNCYEQAWVHILSNRQRTGFFTINDAFNDPQPVDGFYHIEGVAIKPKGTGIGPTTLVVDSAPHGNLDVVRMQPDGEDVASVERHSYRASVCGDDTCSWKSTQGNSLAIDYGQAMLYLADNNSYPTEVRALRFTGTVDGEVSRIPVGGEALCWVFLQSVTVAQGRNALYVPSGCQSFEHGSTVVVDTDANEPTKTITVPYGDQGIVAVDPHDPRRVFITTSDARGDYDPDQLLRLHMLYDDVVVASLPLLPGFGLDNKSLLRDMVFDPASSRLFISVGQSILVVDVGGVPPAEMWPEPVTASITPEHGGELKAADGSATFTFSAGDVDQTSQVTYTETAPHAALSALAGSSVPSDPSTSVAGTTLRPVRTFELTGVISGTTTPLDGFNDWFTLQVETTDKELAGIIPHTLALYWWDGSQWRKQYDVSDVPLGTTYSNHTGRFALMGESYTVYLPLVQRPG
jgi:hypothetical protein